MGDIRFGGFSGESWWLGFADHPPEAINFSLAGDSNFNTGQSWKIPGYLGGYDLFTVAVHEVGHALGLGHSTDTTAVMYQYYNGTKSFLRNDDIAGIRAIYSNGQARSHDVYDAAASNGSFATASDITSHLGADHKALITGLDINSISPQDVDYYKITAPAGTSGTLEVKLQSLGQSLLAPGMALFRGDQSLINWTSGAGQWGTTITLSVTGVSAGEVFYIKCNGTDLTSINKPFSTGAYALAINFGTGATPAAPTTPTATPKTYPLVNGGWQYDHGHNGEVPRTDVFGPEHPDHDHDDRAAGHGSEQYGDTARPADPAPGFRSGATPAVNSLIVAASTAASRRTVVTVHVPAAPTVTVTVASASSDAEFTRREAPRHRAGVSERSVEETGAEQAPAETGQGFWPWVEVDDADAAPVPAQPDVETTDAVFAEAINVEGTARVNGETRTADLLAALATSEDRAHPAWALAGALAGVYSVQSLRETEQRRRRLPC
jgi:hypothetical protein